MIARLVRAAKQARAHADPPAEAVEIALHRMGIASELDLNVAWVVADDLAKASDADVERWQSHPLVELLSAAVVVWEAGEWVHGHEPMRAACEWLEEGVPQDQIHRWLAIGAWEPAEVPFDADPDYCVVRPSDGAVWDLGAAFAPSEVETIRSLELEQDDLSAIADVTEREHATWLMEAARDGDVDLPELARLLAQATKLDRAMDAMVDEVACTAAGCLAAQLYQAGLPAPRVVTLLDGLLGEGESAAACALAEELDSGTPWRTAFRMPSAGGL